MNIITYFRIYNNEELDTNTIFEISDKLEDCKFMAKKYSKMYCVNLSVDNGMNFFAITDKKGNPIIFSEDFNTVLGLFYSYIKVYDDLIININETFELIQEKLKNKIKED